METSPQVEPVAVEPAAPVIRVCGEPLRTMPKDLYIPPDAMEVFLETFTGPLDLLLYLIRKQNLNILDIPIAEITRQYMEYVELMKELSLELAAEYLVMAALLAEIKSRMLLPRATLPEENEGEDPRSELIRRLQEYERIRDAAEKLETLPREGRDFFAVRAAAEIPAGTKPHPPVALSELVLAFAKIMQRAKITASHLVQREPMSVRERMTCILARLKEAGHLEFSSLFTPEEGKKGLIVSFLALLELLKAHLVDTVQTGPFAPIHLRAVA